MAKKTPEQPGRRMRARIARAAKQNARRLPKHIADMPDPSDEELAAMQEEANSYDETPAYLSVLEDWFRLDGYQGAIPDAIAACAESGSALPAWAAEAFLHVHHQVRSHELRSWDDGLGKPLPKGKHLATERRNKMIADRLRKRAGEILASEDLPIDAAFFERLGEEFNLSGPTARRLYYHDKRLRRL